MRKTIRYILFDTWFIQLSVLIFVGSASIMTLSTLSFADNEIIRSISVIKLHVTLSNVKMNKNNVHTDFNFLHSDIKEDDNHLFN